ncbi:MAG: lysylphosphatidylglycerol synthase transmembrane domain-containing protein [archaeon]
MLSWVLSLILVIIIVSLIDSKEVIKGITKIGLTNFVLLSAFYSIGYVFRALRWKAILKPIARISLKESFFITNTGFLVNAVLPARAGEIARAYILAKKKNLGKIKSFSTVMLDRVIDGMTLFLFFVVSVIIIPVPEEFKAMLLVPALIFLSAFAFFFKPDKFRFMAKPITAFFPSVKGKIEYVFHEVKESGKIFYSEKKQFFLVFFYSGIVWVVEALLFYFTARIIGTELSLPLVFLLVVVTGFAAMIPSAPNYIGTFEAGFIVFFTAFGLSNNSAVSVAVTVHLIETVVILVLGVISMNRLGLSFKSFSEINFQEIKNKRKVNQK